MLAEGAGGLAVARAIQARLPAEDVAVLADHAYAPYARRSAQRRHAARAPALAAELAADGIKLLVVASLQMAEDALAPIAAAAGVPTLALDATLPYAARRASKERIAALWADGTLRAVPWLKRHAFERGGREVVALPWPGLAEAIEAGRHPDPASVPTVPDDCVVGPARPVRVDAGGPVRRSGRLCGGDGRPRPPAARPDAGAGAAEAARADPAAELAPGAGAGRAAGAAPVGAGRGAGRGRGTGVATRGDAARRAGGRRRSG